MLPCLLQYPIKVPLYSLNHSNYESLFIYIVCILRQHVVFSHLSMQKIKVLLVFLTRISLVTRRLHGIEQGSEESG